MVGTKSRGYSNSARLSEGRFLAPVPALEESVCDVMIWQFFSENTCMCDLDYN